MKRKIIKPDLDQIYGESLDVIKHNKDLNPTSSNYVGSSDDVVSNLMQITPGTDIVSKILETIMSDANKFVNNEEESENNQSFSIPDNILFNNYQPGEIEDHNQSQPDPNKNSIDVLIEKALVESQNLDANLNFISALDNPVTLYNSIDICDLNKKELEDIYKTELKNKTLTEIGLNKIYTPLFIAPSFYSKCHEQKVSVPNNDSTLSVLRYCDGFILVEVCNPNVKKSNEYNDYQNFVAAIYKDSKNTLNMFIPYYGNVFDTDGVYMYFASTAKQEEYDLDLIELNCKLSLHKKQLKNKKHQLNGVAKYKHFDIPYANPINKYNKIGTLEFKKTQKSQKFKEAHGIPEDKYKINVHLLFEDGYKPEGLVKFFLNYTISIYLNISINEFGEIPTFVDNDITYDNKNIYFKIRFNHEILKNISNWLYKKENFKY